MRIVLILTLSLYCYSSFAQLETKNWYLTSNHIAITPSGVTIGLPVPPLFYTSYCSSSISDIAGNLLLATNGHTIIGRNQLQMPALTNINLAGSQGKTLIQKLINSNKYCVFYTTRNNSTANSSYTLKYAIVDMSLNNGNGDVVVYDQVIESNSSPSYTLAEGDDPTQAWLVTHRSQTDSFFNYRFTATGIDINPVISKAGTLASTTDYIFRDLKTSFDGRMIAGIAYKDYTTIFAITWGVTEVFNFNANTGIVTSRVRTRRNSGYFSTFLSVDFSPDNRLLYTCNVSRIYGLQPCGYGSGSVRQLNLCYTDSLSFDRYAMTVASDYRFCASSSTWGNIKTAADKRMHLFFSGTTVSTINNPNRIGTASNYVFNSYALPVTNSTNIQTPDFSHKLMEKAVKNNIVYEGGCYPNATNFSITNNSIQVVLWNFGDPASGVSNTTNVVSPSHLFSAPGSYTVKATIYNSTNMIIDSLSELVEIRDPSIRLLHNYPQDTSFCQGGSLNLNLQVTNGLFEWQIKVPGNPPSFMQVNDNLTVNSSGRYYVKMIQNACNGCVLIDSIDVTVNQIPYVSLGSDKILCTGDSIRIGVYDYNNNINCVWNTGETTDSIWVRNPGQYSVSAQINNNGCPATGTINITLNPALSFSLPPDTTLCAGQSLYLNVPITGAQYLWQDNSTASNFNVTSAGLYWVRVTKNGCSKTDSILVGFVPGNNIYLGADTSLCNGDQLSLSAGISANAYLWSTGATTQSIQVLSQGQYWVKAENNGCWAADTINVLFNPKPYFSLGNDSILCENKSLTLSSPIPADTYLWQDNSVSPTFAVNSPGLYWLELNKNGCKFRDSINIAYKASPVLFLGNDASICAGQSILLNANSPSAASFLWQDGSTNATYTATSSGTYFAEVTGLNQCKTSDTIRITSMPYPNFSLGPDTTICAGNAVSLKTNINNLPHLWNTGNNTNSIIVNNAGLFWVEVNNGGCKQRDSINVFVNPTPKLNLGNDTLLCEGNTIFLDAFNNGATYLWKDNSTTSGYNVNRQGEFYVTVNLNGCKKTDTINIDFTAKPFFNLGKDTFLCSGQAIVLKPQVNAPVNYLWQDRSNLNLFTVKQPGYYSLLVTNKCGTYADTINVLPGSCSLELPNAFTPNKDGVNDVFRIKYPFATRSFNFCIYNKWGEKIFETTDIYRGWDGRLKGEYMPMNSYVWTINLVTNTGEHQSAKGVVTLIR